MTAGTEITQPLERIDPFPAPVTYRPVRNRRKELVDQVENGAAFCLGVIAMLGLAAGIGFLFMEMVGL